MSGSNGGNKYIFNKIFTGSYLIYNLGHELINFMRLNNGERFIYLNPYGGHAANLSNAIEYVLHVVSVKYEGETYYELIAVSKIKKSGETRDLCGKDSETTRINVDNYKFKGHKLTNIFENKKSHLFSFFAEEFLLPKKNTRVLFGVTPKEKKNSEESIIKENVDIKVEKNIEVFDNEGTTIYTYTLENKDWHNITYSKSEDEDKINDLLKEHFEVRNDYNIALPNITEQCLSVICDRTKLEDSTSNQIAYFLNRDKGLMKKLVGFLNIKIEESKTVDKMIPITSNTKFEVIREKNNIDLLILIINSAEDSSNNHVIVIENKIDSDINGTLVEEKDKKEGKKSQLSKYYNYICNNKDDNKEKNNGEFLTIPIENKHFFILKPDYSFITKDKLKKFLYGDKYSIISYGELYREVLVKHKEYNPLYINSKNKESDEEKHRQFLYDEFKKTIKYINLSNADLMKEMAYIRLNQRIEELNNVKNSK